MKRRTECLIIDYGFHSANWLSHMFKSTALIKPEQVARFAGPESVVVFEGGADISPRFYNSPTGAKTVTNPARDAAEHAAFMTSFKLGAAYLGICRGAQFLTAMAGGKLIQHVTGHNAWHDVVTKHGEIMLASSAHHQMMFPYNLPKDEWNLLSWTPNPLSVTYLDGHNDVSLLPPEEPEIVYYPRIRSLCIQAHPEWHTETGKRGEVFLNYCKRLVRTCLIEDRASEV